MQRALGSTALASFVLAFVFYHITAASVPVFTPDSAGVGGMTGFLAGASAGWWLWLGHGDLCRPSIDIRTPHTRITDFLRNLNSRSQSVHRSFMHLDIYDSYKMGYMDGITGVIWIESSDEAPREVTEENPTT